MGRGASYRPNYDASVHRVRRRNTSLSPLRANVSNRDTKPPDAARETDSAPKRRKVQGDYYRPEQDYEPRDSKPRALLQSSHPTESALSIESHGVQGPPSLPTSTKPRKLPQKVRRKLRLEQLEGKIQTVREELHTNLATNQTESERLLAVYSAEAQGLEDDLAKDGTRKRFNTVRLQERQHAQRVLKELCASQNRLRMTFGKSGLDANKLRMQSSKSAADHLPSQDPVSEDEEEGGVQLPRQAMARLRIEPSLSPDVVERPKRLPSQQSNEVRADDGTLIAMSSATPDALSEKLTDMQRKIHHAEVDLNYCCFAPLKEPYICLYPVDERRRIQRYRKKSGGINERKGPDPNREVQLDIEAGILRSSSGDKPPFWSEVEERMHRGTLEELRDGKLNALSGQHDLAQLGDKNAAMERAAKGAGLKRTHAWMDDDGMLAEEDLDTEDDDDGY